MTKRKKKPLKCDFDGCENKSFSSHWVLNRHFERMHASEYPCTICDKTFDSAVLLNKHKKVFIEVFRVIYVLQDFHPKNIYLNIMQDSIPLFKQLNKYVHSAIYNLEQGESSICMLLTNTQMKHHLN